MDRYTIQTSEYLDTLSVGDREAAVQYQSMIPLTGSSLQHVRGHGINTYQQSSFIPLSFSEDHMEKSAKINGFKPGLHIANGHLTRLSPSSNHNKDSESGNRMSGIQPVCLEFQRPRSHSMGLAVTSSELQTSRSHSRDSLVSCDSSLDEYQVPKHSGSSEEALVEVTCNKFKRLSAGGAESPHSVSPVDQRQETKNVSHSPPFCDPDVVRKYSFGSHMLTAKRPLSNHGFLQSQHGLPIDLTCKRKKSDTTSNSLGSLLLQSREIFQAEQTHQNRPESKEQLNQDQSILKSVLVGMGRKRSHTLSVCDRQHFRKDSRENPIGISPRQRVTLAKRNLGPVMGRISEYLNRIMQFLSSQPDFVKLSSDDQRSLVTDSVHRLLMLHLAESNLQFVITPVRDDDDKSTENGATLEEPTMQFTETVQSFIIKCQSMNISSSEYTLMRILTLFHTGSKTLQDIEAVERANAESQQKLQGLVLRCYPNDRLRYSKLLLSIYTLFGINCPMLEALFCRHLIPSDGSGGGLARFVFSEFLSSRGPKIC